MSSKLASVTAPLLATSGKRYTIVLDHRVRQKLVAHGFQLGFGLGLVGRLQLDVEHLALTDGADPVEAEAGERVLDRFALRVEHAVLEGDGDAGLDHAAKLLVRKSQCGLPRRPSPEATSTGPVGRGGSFSFMMPRRRATS